MRYNRPVTVACAAVPEYYPPTRPDDWHLGSPRRRDQYHDDESPYSSAWRISRRKHYTQHPLHDWDVPDTATVPQRFIDTFGMEAAYNWGFVRRPGMFESIMRAEFLSTKQSLLNDINRQFIGYKQKPDAQRYKESAERSRKRRAGEPETVAPEPEAKWVTGRTITVPLSGDKD